MQDHNDLTNQLPVPTRMPTSTGMIRLKELSVVWASKFPIKFSALNAAVKWYLLNISGINHTEMVNTAGLIGYSVTLVMTNTAYNLGEVYVRELPDEQHTGLIITAPVRPESIEGEEIVKNGQEHIFYTLIQQLIDDYEIAEAIKRVFSPINLSFQLSDVFKGYDKISQVDVTEEDLQILHKLLDKDIRERLAQLVLQVDPGLLARESRKPHGVSEISDMELPITLNNKHFYLCIQVKSASDKASKQVAYQIVSPFLNLNSCAMVLVSAKKCSEPLMNEIKKMRDRFGWTIEVIQEIELARLFKINGLL